MAVVVYGDVLFLVNFSMDFLCLYVTGRLFHVRMQAGRLAIGAAIGAVYAVWAVFRQDSGVALLAAQGIVSAVMAAAAFGRRRCWLYAGVMWLCGAALGGMMTGIFHLLCNITGRVLMGGNVVDLYGNVSAGAILTAAGVDRLADT